MRELILGIDPGSQRTGYGLIDVDGDRVSHVEHGVIELGSAPALAARLARLHLELEALFRRHPRIRTTVVEKIFFGRNADSAFKLGHARGVCLLACAQHQAQIREYAARFVKKCVTGSGSASKDQVQMIVFNLLGIKGTKAKFDATDALSLALTHARMGEVEARFERQLGGSP